MKIKELLEQLNNIDPETEIIMSSDDEGNSFRKLHEIQINMSYRNDGYEVEVGHSVLTDEMKLEGYTEDDIFDGEKCIILW